MIRIALSAKAAHVFARIPGMPDPDVVIFDAVTGNTVLIWSDDARLKEINNARFAAAGNKERAEFPLEVAVTNAKGEAWSAVVTLKDGMADCRHRQDRVSLTFPLHLVAIDNRNNRVASMDVMVPGPFPPHPGGIN